MCEGMHFLAGGPLYFQSQFWWLCGCAQESTTGVQLLRQEARKGAASGVTIYDFEYELDR